jgi:hypothetical protein
LHAISIAYVPNKVKLSIALSNIYEKLDRIMEAVEAYKSFIKYAPDNYLPYINRAKQKLIELLEYEEK